GFADGAHVPVGRQPAARAAAPSPNMFGGRGPSAPPLPPAQQRAQSPENRLPFDPSLSRDFSSTDTLRVYFEVARKDVTSTVRLTVMVVDASNRSIMAIDRSVLPNEPGRIDLRLP